MWWFALACHDPIALTGSESTEPTGDSAWPTGPVEVRVTLDGAPVVDARVRAGGEPEVWTTDADGWVVLPQVASGVVVVSHDRARTEGAPVRAGAVEVALETFSTVDNPDYVFQDPGNPDDDATTDRCAHCHASIGADWFASPHARSASNPVVHDVYAGAAAAFADPSSCAAAGGAWWTGVGPGTGRPAERCYLGHGTLPDLDPGCGRTSACDAVTEVTGGCADCHAPGLDGQLGGRGLLEATGLAARYGVHCDVCHRVNEVDPEAERRGVAGALILLRPSDPDPGPRGGLRPLTFGPWDDVPNPRMGSVARDLFHGADLCAGCHELGQAALVPGTALDPRRWPDGRLPIHSTWSEWREGPLAPQSPCQSCHMPGDPTAGNGADLGTLAMIDEGASGGWYRPPGSVRRHTWAGPRQRSTGLLDAAAALDLRTALVGDRLTVEATVTNTGAGHRLPTGEPLRAVLLVVAATCGGQPLTAIGGEALPAWAGALDEGPPGSVWPGARPGDRLRVVRRPGTFLDYDGFGPFGDGTFAPADKGLPLEVPVGESTVLAVDGSGRVTLSAPLPVGDHVYRVPAETAPEDGAPATALAGAPGAAFARVLVDAAGEPFVPHHRAVDVRSDRRLAPLASSTSTHVFDTPCAAPVVSAVLVHRPLPFALARERGWDLRDAVIARGTR